MPYRLQARGKQKLGLRIQFIAKLEDKKLVFHAGSWSSTAQEEAQLNAS
jgi:hypothetical protein